MKLKVKENGELLSYLYDNLDMPKKKIKQYLTHGSIYVNNVKTRQYNYPLINGMEIVIDTDNKNKKVLIDIIDEPLKYQSKKRDKLLNDNFNVNFIKIKNILI